MGLPRLRGGAGFCSPPGCAEKPLLREASIAATVAAGGGAGTPGRQVQAAPQLSGRECGAGQRRRRRRRVAPSRQQPAAAGPRSPRRGRSPAQSAPTQEGARREGGARAPCSARVHLRTWDARPRVPGSPSPGCFSRRAVHPWKSTPGVKAKPALTRRGVAPQPGPRFLQVRWGRGGCAALRGLRRPPSALHRSPSADFLFLGLGPAARPRPGPPLSARSCGLRRQRAADPPVPPPLCPGARKVGEAEGGERERERLSTWTCLWTAAKESSQITAPGAGGGGGIKKKKILLLFLQTRHFSSFSGILRVSSFFFKIIPKVILLSQHFLVLH